MIDTAWLDDTDEKTYGIDDVDLNIWGDWGYGGEGSEYDPTMQYGDPRLEEQLWGDDDIILVGEGYGDQTTNVRVWAGDGDDDVDIAFGWYGHEIFGGRGDDTITFDGQFPTSIGTSTLNGGPGDDLFQAGDNFATNSPAMTLVINGGEGKNRYEGFDGAAVLTINGGDDDEVMIGGANVGQGNLNGGAGNDIVYGSGDADALTPGTLDLNVDLGDGDDRFYGGEGGLSEDVIGGLGNDTILGGLGFMTSKLYGD